jgi:DNA repair protein RadC
MLDKTIRTKKPLTNIKQAGAYLSKMIFDKNREQFIVLTLDARNVPKSVHLISLGTINASIVHPREVFVQAIKRKACAIIIAHNHPSGGLEPSEADIALTGRISDAGRLLGIELHDSIVMDSAGHYRSII